MTKQPEALRLANLLDLGGDATRPNHWEAAAELRRLYEVNAELLEALQAFDNAAKESTTIITFAGRSLKLLTQARAAIAKAARQRRKHD